MIVNIKEIKAWASRLTDREEKQLAGLLKWEDKDKCFNWECCVSKGISAPVSQDKLAFFMALGSK